MLMNPAVLGPRVRRMVFTNWINSHAVDIFRIRSKQVCENADEPKQNCHLIKNALTYKDASQTRVMSFTL